MSGRYTDQHWVLSGQEETVHGQAEQPLTEHALEHEEVDTDGSVFDGLCHRCINSQ